MCYCFKIHTCSISDEPMNTCDKHPQCPLADIATEIITRLARIEESQATLTKHVITGNGVPSLLKRVDDLEAAKSESEGKDKFKNKIWGGILALVLAILSAGGGVWAVLHHDEVAVEQGLAVSDQKLSDEIQGVKKQVINIEEKLDEHDSRFRK